MDITAEQLGRILPAAAGARAYLFAGPISQATTEFGVDTGHELASFLAQIGVETGQLQRLEENLNYRAQGLANTWARFSATGKRGGPPNALALEIERQPQRIANVVYANRFGNGDEASGDGWRYRGRGGIQVTFLDNYRACGRDLGLDLVGVPELLLEPLNAMRSAGWYWKVKGLDRYDDDADAGREGRIVNGGDHGAEARQAILNRALEVLA